MKVRPLPIRFSFLLALVVPALVSAAEPALPSGFWRVAPDLVVGGAPSTDDFRALEAAGFRTFLNLRSDDESGVAEEEAFLAKEPVRYVQVPVSFDSVGLTEVEAVRAVVADPKSRPLVFHCRSSNRVGMMLAVLAAVDDGKTIAEAQKVGEAAGMKSDDAKETFVRLVVEAKK